MLNDIAAVSVEGIMDIPIDRFDRSVRSIEKRFRGSCRGDYRADFNFNYNPVRRTAADFSGNSIFISICFHSGMSKRDNFPPSALLRSLNGDSIN